VWINDSAVWIKYSAVWIKDMQVMSDKHTDPEPTLFVGGVSVGASEYPSLKMQIKKIKVPQTLPPSVVANRLNTIIFDTI
jgi:hypothetical protein